jgi:hypothetical protein
VIDAAWSFSLLNLGSLQTFQSLITRINQEGSFDRVSSDVSMDKFNRLADINCYLKANPAMGLSFTPQHLVGALAEHEKFAIQSYKQSRSLFDPFKLRIIQAVSSGLAGSHIDHKVLLKQDIIDQSESESFLFNKDKYPYQPDLVLGYHSQKMAVYVLNDAQVTTDTQQPMGDQVFKMKVISDLNANSVKCIPLPVSKVLKLDLATNKVSYNPEFNFHQMLETNLQNKQTLHMPKLVEFGKSLMQNVTAFCEKTSSKGDVQKLDRMAELFYQIVHTKQQAMLRLEFAQRKADLEQVKMLLFKLNLLVETMSAPAQKMVSSHLTAADTLKDFLVTQRETVDRFIDLDAKANQQGPLDAGIDLSWIGVRQSVELPALMERKNIAPEILNQRFLQKEDYFQYPSWKQKLQSVYDNFNLLVVPSNEENSQLYYSSDNFMRRVP